MIDASKQPTITTTATNAQNQARTLEWRIEADRIKHSKTHYETLGISTSADLAEIKKQFKRLSLLFHPDKSLSDTLEIFQKIEVAYKILSDPKDKRDYNLGRHHNNPMNYNPEFQSRKYPFLAQTAPCNSCHQDVNLFANPFPFFCPHCKRMTNLFPPPNYHHSNYDFGSTTLETPSGSPPARKDVESPKAAEAPPAPAPQPVKPLNRRRRRTKAEILAELNPSQANPSKRKPTPQRPQAKRSKSESELKRPGSANSHHEVSRVLSDLPQTRLPSIHEQFKDLEILCSNASVLHPIEPVPLPSQPMLPLNLPSLTTSIPHQTDPSPIVLPTFPMGNLNFIMDLEKNLNLKLGFPDSPPAKENSMKSEDSAEVSCIS
eukprot:TRINITY_DN4997_c0_g1_i1.p1 TRINITY_DN4997_c0_g1~~TRINITY_DN4997_c0_g1_i1.p1  ORF type:complete len:376 (-),score=95.02 TRINITY_DN4997_c0_g1_i1:176-1303(-)